MNEKESAKLLNKYKKKFEIETDTQAAITILLSMDELAGRLEGEEKVSKLLLEQNGAFEKEIAQLKTIQETLIKQIGGYQEIFQLEDTLKMKKEMAINNIRLELKARKPVPNQ